MQRVVIDLLRHGELEGGVKYRGRTDDPLTAAGRLAMDQVWAQIHAEIDQIITSPLARCAEPSRAWAAQRKIPCRIEPRLVELDYGQWEGLSAGEIEQQWPGQLAQWRRDPSGLCPPQGESPESLQARVAECWREITADAHDQHLLLVTHSGTLRMILAQLLGGTQSLDATIAATRRFAMPYACWSRIAIIDGQPTLQFHARTPRNLPKP